MDPLPSLDLVQFAALFFAAMFVLACVAGLLKTTR